FTAKANDWELFLAIECTCLSIARKIELPIKRMKSSSYIRNLKNDPALIETLKARYSLLEHQVLGLCHSEVLPDIYHSPMPGTCQLDLKDAILSAKRISLSIPDHEEVGGVKLLAPYSIQDIPKAAGCYYITRQSCEKLANFILPIR